MISTNHSSCPRGSALTVAVLCAAAAAFIVSPVALTQSRIIAPQRPANTNNSVKRPRVATLRASDSTNGSRVALTADQSLNDYEAYRRGDRFYVRIPAADVPRPEAVRGRAFGDVKVQRGSNDTVVSFRLQPGATARVEQRGNKLDVVFTMPGARSSGSSSLGRDVARNDAGPAPPVESQRRGNANTNSSRGNSADRSGNRNSADRTSAAARPTPTPRATPSPKPSPTPSAKPSASPATSGTPRSSAVVAQQRSSPSPTASAGATQATAQGSTWSNFKQRARYWLLLAQLNPVPVGIGVAVFLLLIGLLVMQRRRAKATRRSRFRKPPKPAVVTKPQPVAVAAEPAAQGVEPVEADAALAGATVAAAALPTEPSEPAPPRATDAQDERVTQASEEVKKLMAGGDYDESIIASEDKYTRQLVGAELLSALVGRNLQRRERARVAFMKHGYFDDATRDLRIAESPNERAAAARRLSFVHDREATPHLMAALEDSSPDVRRASVEALMDLRDPAAIAPLNSLMQTETDRRVPRSLIKHAIEACATTASDETAARPAVSSAPEPAESPMSQTPEPEREVIEI